MSRRRIRFQVRFWVYVRADIQSTEGDGRGVQDAWPANQHHGGLRNTHGFHFSQWNTINAARWIESYIDTVLQLAERDDVLIATYGDMIRVPGRGGSLETKQPSANVKVVLSSDDALELARDNPTKKVVFIAVGFETTAPATAVVVRQAAQEDIENFFILSGHKLVVPAMRALVSEKNHQIDAFLCPGHVSAIIGYGAFAEIVEQYGRSCVVAGFEPMQIIEGLGEICRQIAAGKAELTSIYTAVVTEKGNTTAQEAIAECFEPADGYWR
ncbi:MAG: hydrogenase formation protein HypD, partial [Planctomycetota bacterium]